MICDNLIPAFHPTKEYCKIKLGGDIAGMTPWKCHNPRPELLIDECGIYAATKLSPCLELSSNQHRHLKQVGQMDD